MVKGKRSLNAALASVIAAAYAALVIALPGISFMAFQVRVADALLPLSIVLGWPAVVGVTVGCFVGNMAAPWGSWGLIAIDMIGGSFANFLASYLAYKIAYGRGRARRLVAVCVEIVVVTLIVGTYLTYIIGGRLELGPLYYSILIGVLIGSIVAIGVMGYALVEALERTGIIKLVRSS